MNTIKYSQILISICLCTSLMSILDDNTQEYFLVDELLPSTEFELIDLGRLDEMEFENAEDCFDDVNNIRYELTNRRILTKDNNISGNNNSNFKLDFYLINNEENIISPPNSKISLPDEYFKFTNPLCKFLFDNYQFDTKSLVDFIKCVFTETKQLKNYNLVLKKQINSMSQFAILPLVFTKDEYITKEYISYNNINMPIDAENLNYDLTEFFFNMNYVTKYDFSVINLKKFTMMHIEVKNLLDNYLTGFISSHFISFDCFYNKDNFEMIKNYSDLIYHNKVNQKIPKMVLVSLIMININKIKDKIDVILLYKCLFDILTKLQNENVEKCLIKLLIHLDIYYSKENTRRIYLNPNYFSDRSKFLLNCCNLCVGKDFSHVFNRLNIEIQQLFATYYVEGLTKDKFRELLEIQAFLFNFVAEENSEDYCFKIVKVSNFYNASLISISIANIQTVIKILENNKII
jgi:hypothetical protein